MYGYFGKYGSINVEFDLSKIEGKTITRNFSSGEFSIQQKTLQKFEHDKVFVQLDNLFFSTEGVILNLSELFDLYEVTNLEQLIPLLYNKLGEQFFNVFRGSFSGILYDKGKDLLLIYNDQIGSKLLFYTTKEGNHFFASDLHVLFESLSQRFELQYDKQFSYSMLTFAYSPNCHTLIDGISRIPAGHYVRIEKGTLELKQYHQFQNNPVQKSISETIETLDVLFRQAVKRILSKNEQYGYENCMPLSAGLDSRMTNWVAHQLTNKPIKNVTYSQKGYYDEIIPKEIAAFLGNSMTFQALDGGDYLKSIDESVQLSCGVIHYSGIAQTAYGFSSVDLENVGVIGTGMHGGDVVGTSYTKKDSLQKPTYGFEGYSVKLLDCLRKYLPESYSDDFENQEIYSLYVRGFNCANLGSPILFQNYTESYSPFCDVDFLGYLYSVDFHKRWGYKLYDAWIINKYPEAAKWLHNGKRKIKSGKCEISLCGRRMPLNTVPRRIVMFLLKKTKVYNFERTTLGDSMNPMDSWIERNDSLREAINQYYISNIKLLNFDSNLKQAAISLFENGVVMEQLQVITLLACVNYCKISCS